MSAGSAAVLAVVLGLAALAVRRVLKRGAPCECGGDRRLCGGGGGCRGCGKSGE